MITFRLVSFWSSFYPKTSMRTLRFESKIDRFFFTKEKTWNWQNSSIIFLLQFAICNMVIFLSSGKLTKGSILKKQSIFEKKHLNCRFSTHILPVSAFRQPYTSPKPPRPMIRWTLKSFIVNWKTQINEVFEDYGPVQFLIIYL